ncbi:MAG: hypothetical protein ACFFDH_00105 [Promethearchaeota archaeon]
MRLLFDGLTLGNGPNYYLNSDLSPALDGSLDNITINVPRTDFTKDIDDFLSERIRAFTGTIVGNDQDDFRQKKRALANRLRQTFTFTLEDDYLDTDGSETIFDTYEFTGKIIDFTVNPGWISNKSNFILQIYCEDPNLYLLPEVNETLDITTPGFAFPLVFPFVFSGGTTNTITVINEGLVQVYPTITINGPLTNLTIVMNNDIFTNEQFVYTNTIVDGDSIVITPIPTDPIKVRDQDGDSVLRFTNSNFKAVTLQPGDNVLSFLADADIGENTSANIRFKSAFIAI